MTTRTAHGTEAAPSTAEKLYMENTLLRVAGALFCHDAKRAATHVGQIELNRGLADKSIVIRPDPELGQPGPLAHKIFVALIKKHSSYGRPDHADISFTKRELHRLIGRAEWGGSASEQLHRALDEIHHTFVRTRFKSGDRFIEHSFNLFPEIYLERRQRATDPIEACTVTLARPIMASLQDGHFTCLNHGLMQQLGTIGQALYMRLFFHFANLYDGHHQKRLAFAKRYDDICAEWLGGLTVRPYLSLIDRDQLGPHLRNLVAAQFLASYSFADAKGRAGFVITFRPGATFFRDYERFYRTRERGTVRVDFNHDREDVAEPLKVAYLFIERRTGKRTAAIPYVSSREVESAKFLLARVGFDAVPEFLDFALAAARKTRFDVQSLGGLKQYLPAYDEHRAQRAAQRAQQTRREAEERAAQLRMEYDRYRRAQANQVFQRLPSKEQAKIESAAQTKRPRLGRGSGSLTQTFFEIERARITAQRHPDAILSFEQWQRRAA